MDRGAQARGDRDDPGADPGERRIARAVPDTAGRRNALPRGVRIRARQRTGFHLRSAALVSRTRRTHGAHAPACAELAAPLLLRAQDLGLRPDARRAPDLGRVAGRHGSRCVKQRPARTRCRSAQGAARTIRQHARSLRSHSRRSAAGQPSRRRLDDARHRLRRLRLQLVRLRLRRCGELLRGRSDHSRARGRMGRRLSHRRSAVGGGSSGNTRPSSCCGEFCWSRGSRRISTHPWAAKPACATRPTRCRWPSNFFRAIPDTLAERGHHHVQFAQGPGCRRDRRQQGHRPRHRQALRRRRMLGRRRSAHARRCGESRRRDRECRRQGESRVGRCVGNQIGRGDGEGCGRRLRRHRHPLRQCRHLSGRQARHHDRRRFRSGDGHQSARHLPVGQRVPFGAQEIEGRPHRGHLLDHRPDHRLSGLVALRSQQGRPARLRAHGRDRACAFQHHDQRGHARQYRDRRA